MLPSEPYLMGTHGSAAAPRGAAMRELRERGLIITLPGKGSFVAVRS